MPLDSNLLSIVATHTGEKDEETGVFDGKGSVALRGDHAYEGEFRGGALSGEGVYTWASGLSYRGMFVDSKATGSGVYEWTDGSTFRGDVLNGKRHGVGTFVAAPTKTGEGGDASKNAAQQGTEYAGGYRDGKKHGRGRMLYAGGAAYYDGEWSEGLQHGRGKMRYPSGSEYDGEWDGGVKSGYGTMAWKARGEQYEGQWLAGQPHGLGVHTWLAPPAAVSPRSRLAPRWNRYEGGWRDGARDGFGTFYYADGSQYVGEWRSNRKHGFGSMTFKNGATYRGEFAEDQMADAAGAAAALAQRLPSVHGANNAYIRISVDDLFAAASTAAPVAAALGAAAGGSAFADLGASLDALREGDTSSSAVSLAGSAPASRPGTRPTTSRTAATAATTTTRVALHGLAAAESGMERLHRVLFRWNSELRKVYDRYAALPLLLSERLAHSASCLTAGQWWCLMRDAGFASAGFTIATSNGVLQRVRRNGARLDSAWRRSAGLSAAPSIDRAAAPAFATFGAHAPHRPLLYREFLEALVRVLVLRAEVCAEASAAPFDVCTIVADGVAKLSLFANLDVATPTEDDAHLLTMAPTASYRVAARQLAPLFCACAAGGAASAQAWARRIAEATPDARREAHAAAVATSGFDAAPSQLESAAIRVRDFAKLVVDASSAAPLAVLLAAVSACFGSGAAQSLDSLSDCLDVEMVFSEFIEAVGRVAHAVATSCREDGGLDEAEWARELESMSRRLLGEEVAPAAAVAVVAAGAAEVEAPAAEEGAAQDDAPVAAAE